MQVRRLFKQSARNFFCERDYCVKGELKAGAAAFVIKVAQGERAKNHAT